MSCRRSAASTWPTTPPSWSLSPDDDPCTDRCRGIKIGYWLTIDPHLSGGQVLLNPLDRQPSGEEAIAYGRRGRLVIGYGVMVHARTDSSATSERPVTVNGELARRKRHGTVFPAPQG